LYIPQPANGACFDKQIETSVSKNATRADGRLGILALLDNNMETQ
jgi:hypothetical protein